MISIIKNLDHRIDNIDTHGWAFNSQHGMLKAWRYTAQGKETLTISINQNTPTITVTVAGTTQLEEPMKNIFDAITRAEQYMASNPSSTDPAPAHNY